MDPLYQENILDHYKHPHNRGFMENADVTQKGHNASCGDDLTIYLKVAHRADCTRTKSQGGQCCTASISEISFEGFGCAISQSGASMLTDSVKGKTVGEIIALTPEIMYELYGVEIGPQREKCAMLAFTTLKEAVAQI